MIYSGGEVERSMEKYEEFQKLGDGLFGVTKLVRHRQTKEHFAVKFIPRGEKMITERVQREVINHRSLKHHNVIKFKEVFVTPTHLAIAMEFAAGGELFDRVNKAKRLSEDEVRYFFQQIISGVSYCHDMEICHRDLKLENILLDGNSTPNIKICDFGYSKSSLLHSNPKSTVGTPAYVAPEVLLGKDYDGKNVDVWSCGVTLYTMLFGRYPFVDQADDKNVRKILQRVVRCNYSFPWGVYVTPECKNLIRKILIVDPEKRIKMEEIKNHPWFLKNLPKEFRVPIKTRELDEVEDQHVQSIEDIMCIFEKAKLVEKEDSDVE